MRFRTVGLVMFLITAAVPAAAQTCLGLPSFSEGPFQASAGVAFSEGAKGFGVGGAFGADQLFAGASLGFTSVDAADSTAVSFGADVGAQFVVSERERIEACPLASVIVSSGPDVGDVDVHGVGLRAGGRLGMVAYESGNWELVPTFGLDIAYDRLKVEVGPLESTVRDTYVIVRAGVGFILNRRLSLLPALGVPLGVDDSDPEFSVLVAYNFGTR